MRLEAAQHDLIHHPRAVHFVREIGSALWQPGQPNPVPPKLARFTSIPFWSVGTQAPCVGMCLTVRHHMGMTWTSPSCVGEHQL